NPFANEWDGNSCGSLHSTAISTMISTSHSDRRTSQRGARNTIFSKLRIGREISKTFRAEAFSTRMTLVTSSIHIQPMAGAVKKSWEFMEFSTPCRRAATRPVPNIRLPTGHGHGTCTEKVARSKPIAGITHRDAPRVERNRYGAAAGQKRCFVGL